MRIKNLIIKPFWNLTHLKWELGVFTTHHRYLGFTKTNIRCETFSVWSLIKIKVSK